MNYSIIVTVLFLAACAIIYKLNNERVAFKAILKANGGDLDAFTKSGNFGVVLERKIAYLCDTMCLIDHFWVDSPALKELPKTQAEFVACFSKYHHRYVYWLFTANNTFSESGEVKINYANLSQLAIGAYRSMNPTAADIYIDEKKLKAGDVREMAKLFANILRSHSEKSKDGVAETTEIRTKQPVKRELVPAQLMGAVRTQDKVVPLQANRGSASWKAAQPNNTNIVLGSVKILPQNEYNARVGIEDSSESGHSETNEFIPFSEENLIPEERYNGLQAAYLHFEANHYG